MSFKKSLIILFAVLTVFAACVSVAASAADITTGDVNGDGEVNILDATIIQKVLAGVADAPEKFKQTADVFADGTVDVLDATTIQKYLVGIYTDIPVTAEKDTQPITTKPTSSTTEPTDSEGWNPHIFRP